MSGEDVIELKCISISLLGNSQVGKTSIYRCYFNLEFIEFQLSSVGIDKMIGKIQINGVEKKIKIWDTPGQDVYRNITMNNLRNCHGVVLVYDVTKEDTFEDINGWISKIKECGKPLGVTIMANKIDMEDKRVITKEQGEELAKKYGYPYYESSAKNDIGIKEAIQKCAELSFELHKNDGAGGIKLDKTKINENEKKKKKCCLSK